MDQLLKSYLTRSGIQYIEHKHRAVFTVEESREIKKQIPGISTKSLFLKSQEGKFYLVCMKGEDRLNISFLRRKLNLRKLNFASPEELKKYLRVTPGSVSIFTMIYPKNNEVNLIVGKKVWDADIVGFHPNINTSTLEITHENLEKFYNSLGSEKQIVDLENQKTNGSLQFESCGFAEDGIHSAPKAKDFRSLQGSRHE